MQYTYPCQCITMIQCQCLTLFVKRQKFKLCNETVSIPPFDTMKTVVFGVRSPFVVTFVTLNIGEKKSNLQQQPLAASKTGKPLVSITRLTWNTQISLCKFCLLSQTHNLPTNVISLAALINLELK